MGAAIDGGRVRQHTGRSGGPAVRRSGGPAVRPDSAAASCAGPCGLGELAVPGSSDCACSARIFVVAVSDPVPRVRRSAVHALSREARKEKPGTPT
jgi:hypothetical protein